MKYRCLIIDDEMLARDVIRTFVQHDHSIEITDEAANGPEAVVKILQHRPDVIFLDIQMPELDGFEVLREVWPHHQPFVVFTTAFDQYALRAFEVNAIDYLLKPVNKKRFEQAVSKAIEYFDYQNRLSEPGKKNIFVRSEFNLVKIILDDIIYIESIADYLTIHMTDRKPVITRMPMKDMLEKLSQDDFARVHRSFILPVAKIKSVRGSTIQIADMEFPIGRTYQEAFLNRYFSE